MKILRSKGRACEKQLSNDNLQYRPYLSTNSLAESRQTGPPFLPILTYARSRPNLQAVHPQRLVGLSILPQAAQASKLMV